MTDINQNSSQCKEFTIRNLWGYKEISVATRQELLDYRQNILYSYVSSYEQDNNYTEEECAMFRFILVDRLQAIEYQLLRGYSALSCSMH